MMDTQIAAVLAHLETGKTLTKVEAIEAPFRTTNLGDIVLRLRRKGYGIEKEMRENLSTGKKYAEYFLTSHS
jgi:hypothetical protein